MSERFTTPAGRFVQGDCFKMQDKDWSGQPRVVKQGPNIGQPAPRAQVSLAILKTPGVTDWRQEPHDFFQIIQRVAQQDFASGQSQRPDFAWKIIDGDSTAKNRSDRVWNTIEGFAGHWVVKFESGFLPKCFSRQVGYDASQQITDPAYIRRGHYISVSGSATGNGQLIANCGLFLNLDMVSWEGYGPEIISANIVPATSAFAQAPVLPAGVTAAPVVPVAAAPTVAPPVAPAVVPAPAPTAAPVPYAGYMAAPVAPPPAPPVVSAVPAPMMLPAAGGATYEQMIGAGWTDATLVQHGMMAA